MGSLQEDTIDNVRISRYSSAGCIPTKSASSSIKALGDTGDSPC